MGINLQYQVYVHFSTSARNGIDGAAPGLDTAIAEAFAARSSTFSIGSPAMTPAIKYPVKVSPAAVVSTAFTG